jgi:hypothetical protein
MFRSSLLLLTVLCLNAQNAQRDLPGMAEGILDQVKLAQQAVASYDKDGALDHIKQGLSLADEIRQNSPDSVRPILVPVYREIDTTTTYTPVKHKDGEMSADRLKKDTSIRGVSGDVTTARLDVTAAAERLQNAQASAANGDWSGANAALAAAAASVVVSQSQGSMPLDMARQNLQLARARVIDGKYKDAAVPLRSAAQALGDFEKTCTPPQSSAVESARQAVLGYANSIAHNHDGATGKIDEWLASLNQWTAGPGQ